MSDNLPRKRSRPIDAAKVMEIGLAAVLVVILMAVMAGFVPLSHPRLAKEAVAVIKKNGVDSCAIGSVHIIVWKGISLRDVFLSDAAGEENRYELSARRIDARYNFFPLVFNVSQIRSFFAGGNPKLAAARPRIDLAGTALDFLRIADEIGCMKSLSVANTAVFTEKKGEPRFRGEGISMAVSLPGDARAFRGSFSTAGMAVSGVAIAERMEGEFFLDGGRLTLSRCKGKVYDGKFFCEAGLDLGNGTLLAGTISIGGLDLKKCYSPYDSSGGRLGGKADFRMTLDSSDLCADSLRGSGTLDASSLTLAEFPFQRALVSMLVYPGLAQLHFKKFRTDFRIKPGRIIETLAQGDGDSLSARASGWFRTDGVLNEKVECIVPPACVGALPSFAQKTLEVTSDGGREFRCRIFGSIKNPKFEIDSDIILRKAVRNMFEDVKANLQQWLK